MSWKDITQAVTTPVAQVAGAVAPNQFGGINKATKKNAGANVGAMPNVQAASDAARLNGYNQYGVKDVKYKSMFDKKGNLADRYRAEAPADLTAGKMNMHNIGNLAGNKNLKLNTQALDAMQTRALSTGDSPWAQMQLQNQGIEQNRMMNQAAQQAMSGANQARSSLAMRGGLSSGAAERLASDSSRNLNAARQGVLGQGNQNRLGVRIADDAQKTQMLQQLPSMQLANSQYKAGLASQDIGNAMDARKFDINTQLDVGKTNAGYDWAANQMNTQTGIQNRQGENLFDMTKYQQDMAGYGANKSADAIAKQGGGKKGMFK